MADDPEQKEGENGAEQADEVLLVAQVRAHFLDGETVDLLPFKHNQDVRAEVNKFIEDWVKTGFLLKENFLYPWHQVKQVEVVSVQALSKLQAKPYLDDWKLDTDAQKAFWKTRKPQGKQEEKKEGNKGGGGAPAH